MLNFIVIYKIMSFECFNGGSMKKKILVIIPAFNEKASIDNTYNGLSEYPNYDAIVINDGSTDQTEDILNNNSIPHICLINNLGIGGAVQTGYQYALDHDYDYAVQFDGDGQHNAEYIIELIKPMEKGECDMVIGSRFLEKEHNGFKSTRARRIGISIVSGWMKVLTGKKITDPTSGFRAVNRKVIKEFSEDYPSEYPESISEVSILKKGYNIKEIQVVMNERTGGVSSIRAWKTVYFMINVVMSMFFESFREKTNVR